MVEIKNMTKDEMVQKCLELITKAGIVTAFGTDGTRSTFNVADIDQITLGVGIVPAAIVTTPQIPS